MAKPKHQLEAKPVDLTWQVDAKCADSDVDPEWFYSVANNFVYKEKARSVCSKCPVRQQCLDTAFEQDDRHGIRAGLTPKARAELYYNITGRKLPRYGTTWMDAA